MIFLNGFSHVWHNYYNSEMLDPFWYNGNILMVGLYAVFYAFCTKAFNGFKLGYSKWLGLFGSQVLGIIGANAIEFILISLIGRGRLNVLPMVIFSLIQIGIALVWSLAFSLLYTKMYPPRKMIIVYGNKNAKYLVDKMSKRNDKYSICESVSCDEGLDEIEKKILKYEAVIISDIPNDLRNRLLKFTFEHSIRTYINPKLSDIIVRGADDFHLFDTPLLLARNDGLKWEQKVTKRFLDVIMSAL
ncbi:MAG: sugar transferase, partial [Hominimerdicola sp.]